MQKMLRRHISCCSFSWGRNFRFPNRRKLNNTVSGLRQLFAAAEKPLKIIDQFMKSKPLVCKLVVCSDPKEEQNLLTPEDSELADPSGVLKNVFASLGLPLANQSCLSV